MSLKKPMGEIMAVATRPPHTPERVVLGRNSYPEIKMPNCNPGWRPLGDTTNFIFLKSYMREKLEGGKKVCYLVAHVRTSWGGTQEVTFINDLGETYTVTVVVR